MHPQMLFLSMICVVGLLLTCFEPLVVNGFSPFLPQLQSLIQYDSVAPTIDPNAPLVVPQWGRRSDRSRRFFMVLNDPESGDDNEEESAASSVNPYADPNYPDLEFVNYDDPDYSVDQSLQYEAAGDEELLEKMREERRLSNDEYQYQTYWNSVWKAGEASYRGEWTIYYSSTFFPELDDDDEESDANNPEEEDTIVWPRLVQVGDAPLTVTSRASMEGGISITHSEQLEQPMGDADLQMAGGADEYEQTVVAQTYWPDALQQADFRGHQGIMVCGNAWTICTAVPLLEESISSEEMDDDDEARYFGPFREYRVEVGIWADDARFRVKLDYGILEETEGSDDSSPPPPLQLKTMVVCREAADKWPRSSTLAKSLFTAPAGAPGGLYDPPPVGFRAEQYCQVDLDGGATALFPIIMEQVGSFSDEEGEEDEAEDDGIGWVTSLDWTAGPMRYQVDRKVHGGRRMRGLRTLELSEVQGEDAERYRPRDGGQDMRQ